MCRLWLTPETTTQANYMEQCLRMVARKRARVNNGTQVSADGPLPNMRSQRFRGLGFRSLGCALAQGLLAVRKASQHENNSID